ncbi:SRPBCC family protein [uncultured Methylibium sp.]|uniref:SRPBCC family protein n=1 Tax=uncultured Methylibium sp. TaxID=381093 RepID=UPI0025FC2E85|nr:SRPBCC family protein [uncultured Methylibium sp.]
MLKFIAYAAVVVVALLAALLIVAATRPDSFRVQRSLTIQAPPEKIFPLIDDLKGFASWSPYEKKDPAMKRSFAGPAAGPGATYAWDGNKDIGQGSLAITESQSPSRVLMRLDFLRPFEAHNFAEFTLVPRGSATEVTWAMYGPSPYISKVMGLVFDFDTMVGKDFEAGLADLKAAAEK